MMIDYNLFYYLLIGSALGFILGLLPGIGGKNAIILTTPMALAIGNTEGVVFLVSLHSVIHTSSSIPAIAYGVPVTSADMATVQDGYPLAQKGSAAFALGASLSSSVIGGIIGAAFFLFSAPVLKPIILHFGPPEFLIFSIFGLMIVSSLSESGLLRGWIVCLIGMLFAMIGISPITSEPRFTFGSYDLWNGVSIKIIVASMFVIPEMLSFFYDRKTYHTASYSIRFRDVISGLLTVKNHKKLVGISSWYGIMIGMLPGVGSSVSCWMSYAYAKKNVQSAVPFGEGAIAGVIGPEAANNAKEGGALLPTLLIGIPGSSVMAILLASFISLGLPIGADFFKNGYELVFVISMSVLLSNIIAFPLFLAFIPFVTKFAISETRWVSLAAAIISFNIALLGISSIEEVVVFISLLGLGFLLKANNWARAPFLLGFVLWPLMEKSSNQIFQLWGWSVLKRPIFIAMAVGLLVTLVIKVSKNKSHHENRSDGYILTTAVIAVPFSFLVASVASNSYEWQFSTETVVPLLTFTLVAIFLVRNNFNYASKFSLSLNHQHAIITAIFFATIIHYIGGAVWGTYVFLLGAIFFRNVGAARIRITALSFSTFMTLYIFIIVFYQRKELVGNITWRLLGY